ncbi:MAG: hypothetical protein CMJ18_09685 [Phycisphaeraceae bacterium]|nr:hypothetical protein [Phycisphaeraceae bacterium]
MTRRTTLVAGVVAVLAVASGAQAQLFIGGDQDSSSAFEVVTGSDWERSTGADDCCNPINLINGNGFVAGNGAGGWGTHTNSAWTNTTNGGNYWLTDKNKFGIQPSDYLGIPTADQAFVALKFNQLESPGDIRVWNNNDSCCLNRGLQQMRVQISTLDNPSQPSDWTDLGIYTLQEGPGSESYEGELLGAGPFTARHVVLSSIETYGGSNPVLSEVRFLVPEPASIGLLVLGGLMVARRRRA